MITMIANNVCRLCDWMNGYQGKILTDVAMEACAVAATMAVILSIFLGCC